LSPSSMIPLPAELLKSGPVSVAEQVMLWLWALTSQTQGRCGSRVGTLGARRICLQEHLSAVTQTLGSSEGPHPACWSQGKRIAF
jgi:hypothetical protein